MYSIKIETYADLWALINAMHAAADQYARDAETADKAGQSDIGAIFRDQVRTAKRLAGDIEENYQEVC